MFYLIAALMLMLAGAVVALPLWHPRVIQRTGTAAANREVYAARLKELQDDLDAGRLSPEDLASARRDLEKDLTVAPGQDQEACTASPRRTIAFIMLVLMLGAGAALYGFYGNWRVGAEGVEAASTQAVVDMVAALDKRLHTPAGQDDLQGWDMLGHSYMIMGRYTDALQAFQQARRLTSDSSPQELAGYAEALTLSDPSAFMDKALPLFEKTLQLDPHNVQALWYGGLGALQRGDKALAVSRWNAILAQDPPQDYRQYIEKAIVSAGGVAAGASAGSSISLHVSLEPALAKALSPDTTVFVYAQPTGGTGGPPLAARRLQVKDLPLDMKLSDQDAVVPGRTISGYDDLQVTARVSRNGSAVPQAGDLIGRGEWSKTARKPIQIVIDTVLR
ncbi:MAG TPA: c-type cytochrome biogenesis protein CcmI [Gammaproteobacteria bacterium]|jgi:cytochrome c-type biogenesis protein CcmH